MQPLRLAADPKAGLVQMLHRRRHAVAQGGGDRREPLGAAPAHAGDGRRGQVHAEQVHYQVGQALLGQNLDMQQIDHDGGDPRAVLNRRRDALGSGRAGCHAACSTPAGEGPALGDHQGLKLGQIKHLPNGVVHGHRLAQRRAATGAGRGTVIDGRIGRRRATEGFTCMASLPARLLACPFAKAADADRLLLQAVAGRGLAAIAAVQAELALQFGHAGDKRRVLHPQFGNDRQQRRDVGRLLFESGTVRGRCHRHLDPRRVVASQSLCSEPYLSCYEI